MLDELCTKSDSISTMPAKKRKGTSTLPFSSILGNEMKKRNLSIQQIADLSGVSKSVAQGWVTGANPHDLKAVHKLALALGMGFQDLLIGIPVVTSSNELLGTFEEQEFFEGLAKISIKRLIPKKSEKL